MVYKLEWTKTRDNLLKGNNANAEHLRGPQIPFLAQHDAKFQFYKNGHCC